MIQTYLTKKHLFLLTNILLLATGNTGGPLLTRLYFLQNGRLVWLACFVQTAGFPILLIPILFAHSRTKPYLDMKPHVLLSSSLIGLLIGLDNYLYAYGVSKLPVSTSSLIIASQLAFTSVFSYIIVKQRFNAYSINAVILLMVGAALLGLRSSGDRPEGETKGAYLVGFFMTLGAAAVYGLVLPLVELTYAKARQEVTYVLVLKMQMVICVFATGFSIVGMLVHEDFQAIRREARSYELGKTKYYVLLVVSPMVWQCFFLGTIGVIYYASSLLSGIVMTCTLPLTEVLAVIIFHETFQAEKGVSLFLSLWGFVSYFYGEFRQSKKKKKNKEQRQMDDNEVDNELDLNPSSSAVP